MPLDAVHSSFAAKERLGDICPVETRGDAPKGGGLFILCSFVSQLFTYRASLGPNSWRLLNSYGIAELLQGDADL